MEQNYSTCYKNNKYKKESVFGLFYLKRECKISKGILLYTSLKNSFVITKNTQEGHCNKLKGNLLMF